ncbi:MAG: hypothetical protein FJ087_14255 [Deltaproteobacteria bacterium]|nr:hypothetical protein [Deltaproteobacteria bacterium]
MERNLPLLALRNEAEVLGNPVREQLPFDESTQPACGHPPYTCAAPGTATKPAPLMPRSRPRPRRQPRTMWCENATASGSSMATSKPGRGVSSAPSTSATKWNISYCPVFSTTRAATNGTSRGGSSPGSVSRRRATAKCFRFAMQSVICPGLDMRR